MIVKIHSLTLLFGVSYKSVVQLSKHIIHTLDYHLLSFAHPKMLFWTKNWHCHNYKGGKMLVLEINSVNYKFWKLMHRWRIDSKLKRCKVYFSQTHNITSYSKFSYVAVIYLSLFFEYKNVSGWLVFCFYYFG